MPRTRLFALGSLAAAAIVISAAVYLLTDSSEARSILPGAPLSHLERGHLLVDPAEPEGWQITSTEASATASGLVCGDGEVEQVLPVRLRWDSGPAFDRLAWAVLFSTSTGHDYPLFCPVGTIGTILKRWDYFVVFIDAENSSVLDVIHE